MRRLVFFLDHRASNDAADAAARSDDHDRFSARADRMLIASGVAAVVGLGLTVVSIRRFNSSRETKSELAVVPRSGGAAVVWEGSW